MDIQELLRFLIASYIDFYIFIKMIRIQYLR